MVVAEDAAAAGEGVLGELAGLLVSPQFPQGGGELGGCSQGIGVVVAENPAHASEAVLPELAGWFVLLQFAQNGGEALS